MLIQANLPLSLWSFSLKLVFYVRNRVPHSTTGITHYEVLIGKRPSLEHVKVFGCKAYVLRTPRGTKFEQRALENVFLEPLDYGVYRVLVTGQDGMPNLVESRHVTFNQSKFPGLLELAEHMSMDDEASSDDDFDPDNMSESLISDSELVSTNNFNGGPSLHPTQDDSSDDHYSDDPEDDNDCDDDDQGNDNDQDDDEDDDEDGSDASGQDYEIVRTDTHAPSDNNIPVEPRYPRRHRRPPQGRLMVSDSSSTPIKLTTGDEPTLREAFNATSEGVTCGCPPLTTNLRLCKPKTLWIEMIDLGHSLYRHMSCSKSNARHQVTSTVQGPHRSRW